MKYALMTGCIALLVTSCSLFRQKAVHRSTSESESRTAEKQQTAAMIESEQLTISAAALETDYGYQVQIIPEGPFHYSPEAGFTGNARQVTVHGRAATSSFRSQTAAERSSLEENTLLEKRREQHAESHQKEKQSEVERKDIGSWWMWLIGLGLLVVGWKVVRMLIRQFF